MVEAACIKFKNHFWCLSERLEPPTLFYARIPDCDEKEMANGILKYENQARFLRISPS